MVHSWTYSRDKRRSYIWARMTTITCGTAHGNSFLIYLSWDPSPDCWRTCESFRWMFHTLSLPLSHFQTISAPKTYEIHLLDDVSLCLFPSRKFLICFSTPLPPVYPGVTLLELLMRNTDIMEKRNGLVVLCDGRSVAIQKMSIFQSCFTWERKIVVSREGGKEFFMILQTLSWQYKIEAAATKLWNSVHRAVTRSPSLL